jgi:hypothetical protein
MGQIIELPLNSGMDQSTDRALLDQNKLALTQNCRLSRDGRLEVRPGFSTLTASTMSSGSLVAYDLANYQGRLIALGDQLGAGRATDLFEYVESVGKWRATSGADVSSTAPRLPQLTDIRALGTLPDQFDAAGSVKLATGAGYVCAVINFESGGKTVGVPVIGSIVHVFDPSTNQTLLVEATALSLASVVFAGTKFWIVGRDANEDASFYGFDPLVNTSLGSITVDTALTNILDIEACSFGTGWAYAWVEGSSGIGAKTKTSAGAAGVTIAVTATASDACAIAGNSAGTALTVFGKAQSGGDVTARTYNAAGALTAGPTTVFTATTVRRLGACITGSSVRAVGVIGSDSVTRTIAQSGHALSTLQTYFDARAEIAPVLASGREFAGFVDTSALAVNKATYHLAELTNLLPQAFLTPQLADPGGTNRNNISTLAVAGTKIYWPVLTILQDLGTGTRKTRFTVYEGETAGTSRRQMAEVGGELLIAGGLPLTYDGRTLAEQGFAERPVIVSGVESASGSLTLLGVYNAIPLWEVFDGKGRLVRSQAGSPLQVTLTGANARITWTLTTPHSLRRHPAFRSQAFSIRVSLYRTEAGGGVFFLDKQTTIDPLDDPAETLTLVSTQSDTNLIDNAVLYEQSQTPLSHVAPLPYRYVYAARERALNGGQPDGEQWTQSKLLFPGEPVTWASPNQLGFSGRIGQNITAVGAFETLAITWTEQEIWAIAGHGPEHDGSGDFDASARVASPGGTFNWRSVIFAPLGAFFQMRPDRLMLLTRDLGVQWAGAPIQDSLALFPVIVGAVYVRELDQVVFACNNNAGSDGVFLILDLSKNQWFLDTAGEAIRSVSEYGGRLVYVNPAGAVKLQDSAIAQGAGALPTVSVRTGSLRPFSALGYGDIIRIGLLGTYLGDCTVEGFISYDDGKTWTSMGTQTVTAAAFTNALTGAAIAAGDPITLLYAPQVRSTDRFSLRFDVTNSTNTGGVRLHVVSFEAEAQEGTVRRAARDQR